MTNPETPQPSHVHVQTLARAKEIMTLCHKNNWKVVVGVEPEMDEDISDIEYLLNPVLKPTLKANKSIIKQINPGRNEPCWCGSGKKFKHCCLK